LQRKIALFLVLISILTLFSCSSSVPREKKDETLHFDEFTTPPCTPLELDFTEITFIACGDNITYGTKDARSKAVPGGRALNFKPQYANVAERIASADIAFINQECVMAGDGYPIKYYPMFNVPQELGLDLVELGYDVINIATNHMLDAGASGLKSTIDFWQSLDVTMIGGFESEEDFDRIRIVERDGVKIAFLSYTDFTNGLVKPASSPLVIPYLNEKDVIRQTALAKKEADLVFVSVHWGDEGAFTPNSRQTEMAQLMADCGVDAIIGHHPHVLEPIEWLEGKDGNKTLCVYSLGNFVAEQDFDYNVVGGILELSILKPSEGDAFIDKVLFHPTVFHFSSDFYTNIVYYMQDYTPELAEVHGVRKYYGHTLTYDRLINYATSTISKEFLTDEFQEKFNK